MSKYGFGYFKGDNIVFLFTLFYLFSFSALCCFLCPGVKFIHVLIIISNYLKYLMCTFDFIKYIVSHDP